MTKREADLQDIKDPTTAEWLKFFAVIWFIPMLAFGWVALVITAKRLECVQLPNGATIEYASFWPTEYDSFWPSWLATDWPPKMTLRDANGRVLIKSNGDVRFHRIPDDPDMVLLRYGKKSHQELRIFGRHFMSIVFDEEFFGRKWNEPYKEFPDKTSIILTSLKSIHHTLREHEHYRRRWCRSIVSFD